MGSLIKSMVIDRPGTGTGKDIPGMFALGLGRGLEKYLTENSWLVGFTIFPNFLKDFLKY